tara:strand:+ start:18804 stop:19844 length:1041 start_codon:yes stop_codon:yes gene_type:complete
LNNNRIIFLGRNGIGKSNLLEAVELMGTLRSHRTGTDKEIIFHNEQSALISAELSTNELVKIELNQKGGRRISFNNNLLSRHIDLMNFFRCVCFSSLDLNIVRGEPSLRRFWLDRVVNQLEPVYIDLISRYNRLLKQRIQLWKNGLSLNRKEDQSLLDAFDQQMAIISTRIYRRRSRALKKIEPIASAWHGLFSQSIEQLNISYLPSCQIDSFDSEEKMILSIQNQLKAQRQIENKFGNCQIGPHRDEIQFSINKLPARKFGSSGQQRTLVLSLKMAELDLVQEITGFNPILILDDVLAELDLQRQNSLLSKVGDKNQCLISATHIDGFAKDWQTNSQIVDLELDS